MAAYKVINLDSPIEADYWVDIPVRDPATNKDAVDEQGRILVQRHVTRCIKNKELTSFNTAVETLNTLKKDYSTFKEEVSTKVNTHDSNILTNTNSITALTDSVTNHDLQINALYSKINAIKGIDIDDFKYVTETDIKNIKENYLPLAGGTITGDLVLNGKVSSNSPIKADLQGTADRAIGDINGKALTSYIANLNVSGASVTVTNGAGESSNYTVDYVNHATHANSATNADQATHADNLGGYPASNYVRSVNGVNANANGNVQLGNLGVITGEIKWFAFNTAPDGYLVCNGKNVSRKKYANLFAKIGTTYGSGDGSTTFTLPNLIDKFAQGSTRAGTYKSAGLPNITGSFKSLNGGDNASPRGSFSDAGRAFYCRYYTDQWDHGRNIKFNASSSSSIYGNSETVQPPAVTLLPCIKY